VKVLVTGASSLIGRHAVRRLVDRGDAVTTFQRNPAGLNTREVLGSVDDPTAAAEACSGQDVVIHLAARVGVTGRWEDYESVNVRGTVVVLEQARANGVQAFVHVSSPSVAHSGDPLVGSGAGPADPEDARGHYATSKALAEQHALAASSVAMPVVAIRPHLVWGPGDTQLIGRIIERALSGRLALVGAGTALIDTTCVANAADALVAAVDQAPGLGGRALVVSNGEPRMVQEVVSRIVRVAGLDWSPRHVPARLAVVAGHIVEAAWERLDRNDDPPMTSFLAEQLSTAHWFDQRETRDALGWRPSVSLDSGFVELEQWFRQHPPT